MLHYNANALPTSSAASSGYSVWIMFFSFDWSGTNTLRHQSDQTWIDNTRIDLSTHTVHYYSPFVACEFMMLALCYVVTCFFFSIEIGSCRGNEKPQNRLRYLSGRHNVQHRKYWVFFLKPHEWVAHVAWLSVAHYSIPIFWVVGRRTHTNLACILIYSSPLYALGIGNFFSTLSVRTEMRHKVLKFTIRIFTTCKSSRIFFPDVFFLVLWLLLSTIECRLWSAQNEKNGISTHAHVSGDETKNINYKLHYAPYECLLQSLLSRTIFISEAVVVLLVHIDSVTVRRTQISETGYFWLVGWRAAKR